MSELFFTLLISALIFSPVQIFSSPASNSTDDSIKVEVLPAAPVRDYSQMSIGVKVSADSAAVVDFTSGEYLFSKDIDIKLPIASITKLMTALVWLDNNHNWQDLVVMSVADEVYRPKYVYRGEQVTVKDLFYASLVGSDNNATQALVRSSGLTETEFVTAMNRKAEEMGMSHTIFHDVTGLSAENKSTVRDLVLLAHAAWGNDDILNASSKDEFYLSVENTNVVRRVPSTNKLLNGWLTVEAGKTGYIDEAGYCLISKIRDDGHSVIVVVLGSQEETDRFMDSKALAWWAFNNYIWL